MFGMVLRTVSLYACMVYVQYHFVCMCACHTCMNVWSSLDARSVAWPVLFIDAMRDCEVERKGTDRLESRLFQEAASWLENKSDQRLCCNYLTLQ